MEIMKFIGFIVLVLLSYEANCFNYCGDSSWKLYADERCYKVISSNLVTRDEAETLCNNERSVSNDQIENFVPTLAEIHSAEEQNLILQEILGQSNLFDNIWVRAKRKSDNKFYWNDQKVVDYTNWEPNAPSDLGSSKDCVILTFGYSRNQMFSKNTNRVQNEKIETNNSYNNSDYTEENTEFDVITGAPPEAGLWKDVNCLSRQLAFCQKLQTWSVPNIQLTLIQMRRDSKAENLNTKSEILSLKTEDSNLKTDIISLKTEDLNMKTDITSLKTENSNLKIEISNLKTRMTDMETKFMKVNQDLSNCITELRFSSMERFQLWNGPGTDDSSDGYVTTGVLNHDSDGYADYVFRRQLQKRVGGTWSPVRGI